MATPRRQLLGSTHAARRLPTRRLPSVPRLARARASSRPSGRKCTWQSRKALESTATARGGGAACSRLLLDERYGAATQTVDDVCSGATRDS